MERISLQFAVRMKWFTHWFSPVKSFDYNVTMPTVEPPGLYWYHPHPHSISEGQVQGGATGALILQGIQDVFPSLAGMPSRTLVIRDQLLLSSEVRDANIPAWDPSLNHVPVTYPSYTPAVITTIPVGEKSCRAEPFISSSGSRGLSYFARCQPLPSGLA